MDDAVEIARHRPEAIVGGNAAVVEILHLLQHRIGRARDEDVAGQQQHRQPVHMSNGRRRQHIGRTWSDRRGTGHHAPAHIRFRVRDRGKRHGLLVVRAISRQLFAYLIQRFADASHVAVAEDREHAAEQRQFAIEVRTQCCQIAHQCLRHGQADRAAHALPPVRLTRTEILTTRHEEHEVVRIPSRQRGVPF